MTSHAVAMRWLAVALMVGSLVVLAALPDVWGLAGAAVCWVVAYALFEWSGRRRGLIV